MDKYHYNIIAEYKQNIESIVEDMTEYLNQGIKYADFSDLHKERFKRAIEYLDDAKCILWDIRDTIESICIPETCIEKIADGEYVEKEKWSFDECSQAALYFLCGTAYRIKDNLIVKEKVDFDSSYSDDLNRIVIEAEVGCAQFVKWNPGSFLSFKLKSFDVYDPEDKDEIQEKIKECSSMTFPYDVTRKWIKATFDGFSQEDKLLWCNICTKWIQQNYSERWSVLLGKVMKKKDDPWYPVEMYFGFQYVETLAEWEKYDELVWLYKSWKFIEEYA